MSKSRIQQEYDRVMGQGGDRKRYRYLFPDGSPEQEPLQVFFVDQDQPQRRHLISFPYARLFDDGTKETIHHTAEDLISSAGLILDRWKNRYPGNWVCKVVENQEPEGPARRRRVPMFKTNAVAPVNANEIGREAHDVGADPWVRG